MTDSNTKIRDISSYVYLGEYDPNGIVGKLYDMDIYIDSMLSHKNVTERGVQLYFSRYTFETLVKDVIEKSHYPKITFSRFRTLGQGMCGKIAYFSDDMTIKEVIQFLEALHLRLTLTKHKK
jgi:hypothetical protein